MKKGFTLIELLIVVAIIAILAAIAVPNFLEAQVRAKVSRVKNDQRSLATGIETYYVDNNTYPVSARNGRSPVGQPNYNSGLAIAGGNTTAETQLNSFPSFTRRNPDVANGPAGICTLTTPIAYITSYFADPFMDFKGATFGYFNDQQGWVLFSPGPDTDQASQNCDLGQNATSPLVETLYTSAIAQPSPPMIAHGGTGFAVTYDSTNGTVSQGDVWRVKQ
ncbi:MAG: type II secretion system protein [Candidatus Sumerlaeaceae bacterium]